MATEDESMHTPSASTWRWPQERARLPSVEEDWTEHFSACALPTGVIDNEELRAAVIHDPDDDAPRQSYADWLIGQGHEFARMLGAFIGAQLRVAQAFRKNRRAHVRQLRRWRGAAVHVSTAAFRAGDVLRPWFVGQLSSLVALGRVGWPTVYRGWVERVGVRAARFPAIAEELFRLAPIRHLVVIGIPGAVDALAACPHLSRIRSISLPVHSERDVLSDDDIRRFLNSPHLGNVAHVRLVNQHRVTIRGYEAIATAPTLPRLSNLEVFAPRFLGANREPAPTDGAERMARYDAPIPMARSKKWILGLEFLRGYLPCLHPERYYGRDMCDLEAVVENPIVLDARIMARRGGWVSRRKQPWERCS